MNIEIHIPETKDILSSGININVAREKERWEKGQLGDYADKSGLYIQHTNNEIIYIGISIKGGNWGKFSERLRREFQYSSSQNSHLHQLLVKQELPVQVTFYDFKAIDAMFTGSIASSISYDRKTLILEQILIGIYNPEGNRK